MRDRHVDKMEKESSFRWVGLQTQECNVCERACVCVCVCQCVYVVYPMVRQQTSSEQVDLSQAGGIRGKKKKKKK